MISYVTITRYDCAAFLCRLGLVPGHLEYVEVTPHKTPLIRDVQEAVAAYYHLPIAEMTSARRAREVARPRQIAMYLCKRLTLRSLPEIGRLFGGRDHTTIIHGVRQIERLRKDDWEMDEAIEILTKRLAPPSSRLLA